MNEQVLQHGLTVSLTCCKSFGNSSSHETWIRSSPVRREDKVGLPTKDTINFSRESPNGIWVERRHRHRGGCDPRSRTSRTTPIEEGRFGPGRRCRRALEETEDPVSFIGPFPFQKAEIMRTSADSSNISPERSFYQQTLFDLRFCVSADDKVRQRVSSSRTKSVLLLLKEIPLSPRVSVSSREKDGRGPFIDTFPFGGCDVHPFVPNRRKADENTSRNSFKWERNEELKRDSLKWKKTRNVSRRYCACAGFRLGTSPVVDLSHGSSKR